MASSRRRSWLLRLAPALAVWAGAAAYGLETDPFYAWDRDLADSTDAINAHVALTLESALSPQNGRADSRSCEAVTREIARGFRQLVFHPTEIWANNSRFVDRVPVAGEEEHLYRKQYIYRRLNLHPMGEWMPPSPTVSVAGVRIGTDKLAHFFSEGRLYYKKYRKASRGGADEKSALAAALQWGVYSEQRILGKTSSGVFSIADLEANYGGMIFYRELCGGPDPYLERRDERWRLTRAFEFRDYVTPEWDESWQPSVLSRRAWKKVRPEMLRYCDLLRSSRVAELRASYRRRDEVTPTERFLQREIEQGRLADPNRFSIETICADATGATTPTTPTRTSSGPARHDRPSGSSSAAPGDAASDNRPKSK